jgi:hypothetical protein
MPDEDDVATHWWKKMERGEDELWPQDAQEVLDKIKRSASLANVIQDFS